MLISTAIATKIPRRLYHRVSIALPPRLRCRFDMDATANATEVPRANLRLLYVSLVHVIYRIGKEEKKCMFSNT